MVADCQHTAALVLCRLAVTYLCIVITSSVTQSAVSKDSSERANKVTLLRIMAIDKRRFAHSSVKWDF